MTTTFARMANWHPASSGWAKSLCYSTCYFLPTLHEQHGLPVALALVIFTLGLLIEQSYLSYCLFPGRGGKNPGNHHLTLKIFSHRDSDHILLAKASHLGTSGLQRTGMSNIPGGRGTTEREPDYLVNRSVIKLGNVSSAEFELSFLNWQTTILWSHLLMLPISSVLPS